ncbi:MAG: hypothetical protein ACXQS3_05830 [Candidatus Methanofastidiosia archaeon]
MAPDVENKKRGYSWYKHHAWASLAMLTIFLTVTRFFPTIPYIVIIPVVILLCCYAIIAIIFTYKRNVENVVHTDMNKNAPSTYAPKEDKNIIKLEKKRLKAETKAKKKAK